MAMFCFGLCCDRSKEGGGEDVTPLIKTRLDEEEEEEEDERELLSDEKAWPDSKLFLLLYAIYAT